MRITWLLIGLVGLAAILAGTELSSRTGQPPAPLPDSTVAGLTSGDTAADADSTRQVIAYYFYGRVRCATCRKIEAYTKVALDSGFASEMAIGLLNWRPVNTDSAGNEHFVADYQLFTKAVVLSECRAGREIRWKNLDKIWEQVGDSASFREYIVAEVRRFLHTPE